MLNHLNHTPAVARLQARAGTWLRTAGLLAGLAALSWPAAAQSTGILRGRVTDKDGTPMPAAVLTLRSAKNPSVNNQGTLTDVKGEFRLQNLPPGDDYQVSASFPGMATVIQGPIQVQSGTTSTVNFILVQELVTTIKVEAQGSIVDTTSTMSRTTVNEAFLATLPILGRNYTDLLTLAPGVTDTDGDGKPNVHGAREVDFQTRLDGVNITDPFGGEDAAGINIEAIEEVQVIVSGATAEYGRAQGGVSSVTTKTGGNEFEGSFKVFYQTRSLDGDGSNNQDAFDLGAESPSFRTLKPFLTVGGPIVKDRVWYFVANQYIDQQEPINIIGITRNKTTKGWNEFGKLAWQINPSHKGTLEVLYDPRETTGNNIGLSVSPRSDYSIKRATPVFTAHETWVATPTVLLESTLSLLEGRQKVRPLTDVESLTLPCSSSASADALRVCESIPNDTYTQVIGTGQIKGPWWVDQDSDASRLTARQDLSFYVDDFLGSHQFKAGFEWASEDYQTTVEQRPLRYDFGRTRLGNVNLWADFEGRTQDARADADALAIYIQDTWKVRPNLTLNIGLRFDREDLRAPGQQLFDPAAERTAFNELASQVYTSFQAQPGWFESSAREEDFNRTLDENNRPFCDLTGDGVCDNGDRIALSRVFTRHEADKGASSFWAVKEESLRIPPCGAPERLGTCRGEGDLDLSNTNLAPRLSLSFDPFNNGKTKLYATYGRFYDRLFLATIIPEQARDFTYVSLQSSDGGATYDGASYRSFQVYQVSRNLKTPFVDELTLGVERELTPEFSVSVRYIERRGRDQIQTRDINHVTIDTDFDGEPDDRLINDDGDDQQSPGADTFPDLYSLNPFFGGVFFLDNFNSSDYKGLELNLVKRLHRNWQFDASYTYSEALGNAEAFEDFFLGGDTSQVQHEFGHLSFDQRHVVKFNTIAHFPRNLMFGTRITWESGLPFSLVRRAFTFDNLGNPTFRQIYPTRQRNDMRNSGRWLIDLNFRKDFEIGRTSAGVEFTVQNLLNSDDLELRDVNDAIVFSLEDVERRFGRRFQLGFTMNF